MGSRFIDPYHLDETLDNLEFSQSPSLPPFPQPPLKNWTPPPPPTVVYPSKNPKKAEIKVQTKKAPRQKSYADRTLMFRESRPFLQISICETCRNGTTMEKSNSNDGLGEWLFGEPRMKASEAARVLKERARAALIRRVQDLGISIELPKEKREELEGDEENDQESCDSGLPDSCPNMENEEEDVKNLNEMTKSETELSLTDSVSNESFFNNDEEIFSKLEDVDDTEIVEDTIIECLETTLLKMKSSKDEAFLRRLSNTFSPAGRRRSVLNGSFLEDSFDKPVPGVVPLTFKTPRRENEEPKTSTPYFDDSFDRPVPGSVPIGFSKRKSILSSVHEQNLNRRDSLNSNVSENNSFDVFSTPPTEEEKPRLAGKHARLVDMIDSPISSFISSPVMKHAKMDSSQFQVKDVCHNQVAWKSWIKSASSSSSFSISISTDCSGVAVRTDITTTFIPLHENFDGALSPDLRFFNSFSKCVIPLETRLECLKLLICSVEVYVMTMQSAVQIFEAFGLKISRVKVVRIAAHLNNLIACDTEDHVEMFPMLLDQFADPKIQRDIRKILRLGLVYPETSGCKTKQKHLPTNKLILEQIIDQHEIVGKIIEYRHIQHTLTQCLLPLTKYNTRIHCSMEMCTATGRISTSVPNLQNIPKRVSSDGMSARQLFRSSSGNVLIGADHKQLELRVLAHLSNDPTLVSLINEDRDLFGELSSKWKFSRDVVKQLCYGLIYGMGTKTLGELTKVKTEEAEKMLNSFFAMFPGVRSYINETKDKVAKEEHVGTILGRKKLIKYGITGEEKARMERVAVNYTVQGTASEIFKTAIVDIDSKVKAYGANIVLTIHDEVLVDCPEKNVSIVSEIIRNSMQSSLSHLLRVPMKISTKTGESWADLK